MTATANILTRQEKNVLLAPNTALRYKPTKAEDTKENLAIDFRPKQSGEKQVIGIGPGAHKSIYILNNEGNIEERQVLTGYSDGSWTIVTGSNIEPGMLAITGELASKL
jgi:HlyD family secretion protein